VDAHLVIPPAASAAMNHAQIVGAVSSVALGRRSFQHLQVDSVTFTISASLFGQQADEGIDLASSTGNRTLAAMAVGE
jgi:hypothetical protein